MTTLQNWLGDVRFTPATLAMPQTEAEIQALVRAARGRIRVGGARHSWSPLVATPDTYLSLDGMQRLLAIDRERGLVRVQAGMRIWQLNAALAAEGLALPVLGSVDRQSLAGATSTGTHGSSLRWGALHTLVRGLRLVDAHGEIVAYDADDPDLDGARLALGALGVLTELTLQVVPAFRLVEERALLPFDEACDRVPELAASAEWTKLWWVPHTDQVVTFRYHRVGPDQDAPQPTALARWADQRLQNDLGFNAILRLSALVPPLTPWLTRLAAATSFQPRRIADRSDRIFLLAMPPTHFETESAIPLAAAGPVLRGLRDGIARQGLRVNFVQELRFAPADTTWLSGAYGRDTCHFGTYIAGAWHGQTAMRDRFFRLGWDLLAPHEPRPHWGKTLEAPRGLLRRYPRAEDVRRLIAKHDPEGRFRNNLLGEILG